MFFRCESTEMLFYHSGQPLSLYLLPQGVPGTVAALERRVLGPDVAKGQVQATARCSSLIEIRNYLVGGGNKEH